MSEKEETSMDTSDPTVSTETPEKHEFLGFEDFSKFYEQFSLTIKETVSASTKIPLKQNELDYYLTCPAFKNFLQTQNERCLKLISNVLKQQGIKKSNINSSRLDDEERIDMLIDSNDQIIEKLGIQLDEISGLRKKTETELKLSTTPLQATSRNISTSWNKNMGMVVNKSLLQNSQNNVASSSASTTASSVVEFKRKGPITKPQKTFADKIDNSYLPFVPKLRNKPNQLVPLPDIYSKLDDEKFQLTKEIFETHPELLENPYQFEIDRVEVSDNNLDEEPQIVSPMSFENTPFKYIDQLEDLIWLVDHLGKNNRSKIKEIAVDLEHHNYRSFLGFTCLMQISTRYDDFIIDTIKLRSDMHRLNEVFTDWTLIKVLHGSDFDIEWLQKDFGIYVVNMFDTGQASRVLQYPHFSLAYLLQKFCGINAQKQYQLADWRQRPLSDPMIKYAREDTHYLLYIYDNIRSDLIKFQQKEQLKQVDLQADVTTHMSLVLEKSKTICKKTYKKPLFYTKGFLNLCQHNSHLNSKQMKALRDLYEWRDKIARETDESCEYVLKNHHLLKIAELLPREIYGILALCNPLSSVVETNVHEIHEVVKSARDFTGTLTALNSDANRSDVNLDESKTQGNSKESQSKSVLESIAHLAAYDPNSEINCAHDFPQDNEHEMHTDHQSDTTVSLSDIFLKPSSTDSELPDNLIKQSVSVLSSLFNKSYTAEVTENKKKLKTLEDKVKAIKEEMENPFSMFLPREFQTENTSKDFKKWVLLKPLKEKAKTSQESKVKVEEKIVTPDVMMIPLKQQYKFEKYSAGELKPKKRKTNVDFTDAIIEYNKQKQVKVNALGGDAEEEAEMINEYQNNDIDKEIQTQQQKLEELIQKKVQSNLGLLLNEASGSSKNGAANSGVESATSSIYTYNPQSMNKLFAKPEKSKEQFDPASKLRNSKHKAVNKRRMTNAVTRMKNNHSLTYKKSDNRQNGGDSSSKS